MSDETLGFVHSLRFLVDDDDPRPVRWPMPPGSVYHITGLDSDGKYIVVAQMRPDDLDDYWPDAEEVDDWGSRPRAIFTDRLPKPDWFVEAEDAGSVICPCPSRSRSVPRRHHRRRRTRRASRRE